MVCIHVRSDKSKATFHRHNVTDAQFFQKDLEFLRVKKRFFLKKFNPNLNMNLKNFIQKILSFFLKKSSVGHVMTPKCRFLNCRFIECRCWNSHILFVVILNWFSWSVVLKCHFSKCRCKLSPFEASLLLCRKSSYHSAIIHSLNMKRIFCLLDYL